MIYVYDRRKWWTIIRDSEVVILYKDKDVASYYNDGRMVCVGRGDEIRKYMDNYITDDVFDKMVEHIKATAFLR